MVGETFQHPDIVLQVGIHRAQAQETIVHDAHVCSPVNQDLVYMVLVDDGREHQGLLGGQVDVGELTSGELQGSSPARRIVGESTTLAQLFHFHYLCQYKL